MTAVGLINLPHSPSLRVGNILLQNVLGKKVGLMTPVYTIPVIVKICEVQGGECNWCMIDSI